MSLNNDKKLFFEEETAEECPICLENLNEFDKTLTKPCCHYYHFKCIKLWTDKSSSKCPKCRLEINKLFKINENKLINIDLKESDKLAHMIDNDSINTETRNNRNNSSTTNNTNNSLNINHLSNQQCCICDNKVLISQMIICPQCSGLYHRSCSDELNCPLCEEWIDNLPILSNKNKRKRNLISDNDNNNYYIKIVNELQEKEKGNNHGNTNTNTNTNINTATDTDNIEEKAWNALNIVKDCKLDEKQLDFSFKTEIPERKLKKPNKSAKNQNQNQNQSQTNLNTPKILKLTEDTLLKYDKSYKSKSKSKNDIEILSYTQKLIIQRLLIKPRFNKNQIQNLSFNSYTELNKIISHKLYSYIKAKPKAISSLNLLIELLERENYLPLENRKQFDKFHESFINNSILLKFKNCDWTSHSDSEILKIINSEIQNYINNS